MATDVLEVSLIAVEDTFLVHQRAPLPRSPERDRMLEGACSEAMWGAEPSLLPLLDAPMNDGFAELRGVYGQPCFVVEERTERPQTSGPVTELGAGLWGLDGRQGEPRVLFRRARVLALVRRGYFELRQLRTSGAPLGQVDVSDRPIPLDPSVWDKPLPSPEAFLDGIEIDEVVLSALYWSDEAGASALVKAAWLALTAAFLPQSEEQALGQRARGRGRPLHRLSEAVGERGRGRILPWLQNHRRVHIERAVTLARAISSGETEAVEDRGLLLRRHRIEVLLSSFLHSEHLLVDVDDCRELDLDMGSMTELMETKTLPREIELLGEVLENAGALAHLPAGARPWFVRR